MINIFIWCCLLCVCDSVHVYMLRRELQVLKKNSTPKWNHNWHLTDTYHSAAITQGKSQMLQVTGSISSHAATVNSLCPSSLQLCNQHHGLVESSVGSNHFRANCLTNTGPQTQALDWPDYARHKRKRRITVSSLHGFWIHADPLVRHKLSALPPSHLLPIFFLQCF